MLVTYLQRYYSQLFTIMHHGVASALKASAETAFMLLIISDNVAVRVLLASKIRT